MVLQAVIWPRCAGVSILDNSWIYNMKPDFDKMSKAELRACALAHRHDSEAFYKLVDRLKADSKDQVWHPCPKAPEDWEKLPVLIQQQLKKQAES